MELKDIKKSVARIEEIDGFLPRIAHTLEFLSKPGNTLATLNTNCSNGISISVPHEFATMLYVSRRDKLIAERAELAKSLRLDGAA